MKNPWNDSYGFDCKAWGNWTLSFKEEKTFENNLYVALSNVIKKYVKILKIIVYKKSHGRSSWKIKLYPQHIREKIWDKQIRKDLARFSNKNGIK